MKKITVILYALILIKSTVCSQSLSYFLPDSVTYNPSIPQPKDIIYHEVGEWHVTHDRLVNYMKALAVAAPERIRLETMGFTYERRPQVLLIISSQKNLQRLEAIRQEHLRLSDPSQSATVNIEDMPVVVWIGHSIHGNEPSGANAALVSAYYLAAAQGKQVQELLDNVVILFDPSFNPDGLQRFSTWANQHKSKNLVSDPGSREFNEVWPGGRFNHYWFDLNRDWLPAVHVESQHRLEWFHKWKPNILTDHHEQGSNATFFFQPGVPSRVNPLTPVKNQELTAKLGKFHAAFLDRIGSLYFTKESYDDFYYGKGSTYPDVNGAIGILFEQASSRGHLQQTNNGLLSFPFTIRNQFVTTLSTLEGAKALRKEFLQYQREFYKNVLAEAAASPLKGYVFGSDRDKTSTALFVKMLRQHEIEVRSIVKDYTIEGNLYRSGQSYVVPLEQKQNKLVRAIFEKTLDYKDSIFYDITSWTMPLAFGLPAAPLNAVQLKDMYVPGLTVDKLPAPVLEKSSYGYLIPWSDLMAPAVLNALQEKGIAVKAATAKFEIQVNGIAAKFNPGTLFVPVQSQAATADGLYERLLDILKKYNMVAYPVQTGASAAGIDLGSSKFIPVIRPSIAMIVGTGVNATDAGEVWHLLDQRMNITSVHLEQSMFNRTDISKYNTLLMAGGTYAELNKEKLKAWVQTGGTLIVMEEAVSWAAQNGISEVKFKKPAAAIDSTGRMNYTDREQVDGAQQIAGAIFGADADISHPLAFGYDQQTISLFKANKVFMEKSKNPYATPFYYGARPLQSGWVSRENYAAIKNSAAVIVNTVGTGRVINIADNPNFRAFWLGGAKLFMNAIFFGRYIDAASGRTE